MSIFPVGAGVGEIVFRPVLDELPEGLRVFFVTCRSVGTDESVDEGEAVRFPDEFDIGCGVVGDLGPVFLLSIIPSRRKSYLTIFVGEVFEFAVEEAIGFFDGGVAVIIRAGGPRPYGRDRREKFGGVLFAPLGVGIRIRWNIRLKPMLERTVTPSILRSL